MTSDTSALLEMAQSARLVIQGFGFVALVAALVRPGDSGDNAYGPEFYVPGSLIGARPAAEGSARVAATKQVAGIPQPVSGADRRDAPRERWDDKRRQEFLANGPRGKITPGESSRQKQSGFGRR